MSLSKQLYQGLINAGTAFQDVLLLIIRLYWGYSFFSTGLGKLADVSTTVGFFETLNIPFPIANAYLVGTVECVGGLCLLLGFATRLAAIPLIATMLVALATAHKDALLDVWSNPYGLINQTPFTYLLAALIVFAFGPGRISVDALIKRSLK